MKPYISKRCIAEIVHKKNRIRPFITHDCNILPTAGMLSELKPMNKDDSKTRILICVTDLSVLKPVGHNSATVAILLTT